MSEFKLNPLFVGAHWKPHRRAHRPTWSLAVPMGLVGDVPSRIWINLATVRERNDRRWNWTMRRHDLYPAFGGYTNSQGVCDTREAAMNLVELEVHRHRTTRAGDIEYMHIPLEEQHNG